MTPAKKGLGDAYIDIEFGKSFYTHKKLSILRPRIMLKLLEMTYVKNVETLSGGARVEGPSG